MATDYLSQVPIVHSILSFQLIASDLQQNCNYPSPHLVFHLVQFNSISIIENLYDGELDDAPAFLCRNDTSAIRASGGHTSFSVAHKNKDQLQDTRNSASILFQTTQTILPYLQGNRFSPDWSLQKQVNCFTLCLLEQSGNLGLYIWSQHITARK